jgi:hypothetical protein
MAFETKQYHSPHETRPNDVKVSITIYDHWENVNKKLKHITLSDMEIPVAITKDGKHVPASEYLRHRAHARADHVIEELGLRRPEKQEEFIEVDNASPEQQDELGKAFMGAEQGGPEAAKNRIRALTQAFRWGNIHIESNSDK